MRGLRLAQLRLQLGDTGGRSGNGLVSQGDLQTKTRGARRGLNWLFNNKLRMASFRSRRMVSYKPRCFRPRKILFTGLKQEDFTPTGVPYKKPPYLNNCGYS